MHIKQPLVTLILRLGLAFTYIFIAILCFSKQVPIAVSSTTYLTAFGILFIAFAVWILSGKKLFFSSIISLLVLATIMVLNIDQSFLLFGFLQSICLNLALIFSQRLQNPKVVPVVKTETPSIQKSEPAPATPVHEDKAETLL